MRIWILLIIVFSLFYACDDDVAGPEGPDTTKASGNPLLGSWVEIVDTTTEDGKRYYEEMTKFGGKFILDTMTFMDDSTVFHSHSGNKIDYYVSGDTVLFPSHDTLISIFKIWGDTLDLDISDTNNLLHLRTK